MSKRRRKCKEDDCKDYLPATACENPAQGKVKVCKKTIKRLFEKYQRPLLPIAVYMLELHKMFAAFTITDWSYSMAKKTLRMCLQDMEMKSIAPNGLGLAEGALSVITSAVTRIDEFQNYVVNKETLARLVKFKTILSKVINDTKECGIRATNTRDSELWKCLIFAIKEAESRWRGLMNKIEKQLKTICCQQFLTLKYKQIIRPKVICKILEPLMNWRRITEPGWDEKTTISFNAGFLLAPGSLVVCSRIKEYLACLQRNIEQMDIDAKTLHLLLKDKENSAGRLLFLDALLVNNSLVYYAKRSYNTLTELNCYLRELISGHSSAVSLNTANCLLLDLKRLMRRRISATNSHWRELQLYINSGSTVV